MPSSPQQNTASILPAILALAVGIAVLFWGKHAPFIAEFDLACVSASSSSESAIFERDPAAHTITSHTLAAQEKPTPSSIPPFQLITISDDPDQIFEHSPPSPLDYAVILDALLKRGYRSVILTTRMSWDDAPELEAKSLSARLALFQEALIPLPVTRGATAQTLPPPLQRALIPFSQVRGNLQNLPIVNQVSLPASVDGGEHTLAGFYTVESTPASENHIQMLAHWDGQGIIPSLELLTIMHTHHIAPSDLTVHCGKHIRLGKNGPVIPIDPFGQTPKTTPSKLPLQHTSPPIAAVDLIHHIESSTQHATPLIHATGKRTSTTNTLDATQLIKLPQTFPIPTNTTHYLKLPLWAEIVILLALALAAYGFSAFTPGSRLLAFALLATLLFPLLLALMDITHHWLGLTAPLATLLTAWCFTSNQSQSTTHS